MSDTDTGPIPAPDDELDELAMRHALGTLGDAERSPRRAAMEAALGLAAAGAVSTDEISSSQMFESRV